MGTLIALLTSLALLTIITIIFDFNSLISISFVAFFWFSLQGILFYSLARNFLFMGIRAIGASRASAISSSYPLFTLIFAATILKENITILVIIGSFFVIAGLFLILFKEGEIEVSGNIRLWGYFFSLASALCYGSAMVIIKWGVSELTTPLAGSVISLALGSLFLSFVVIGKGISIPIKGNKKAIGFICMSGLFSGIGALSLYSAMSMSPAAVVSSLSASNPLFTLLGAHFFLQRLEKITTLIIIGCFLVVVGGISITLGTY